MSVFENRVIFCTDWNSLVGCVRPTRLTLLSHIIANRLAQKMEGRPNKNVRLCTYTVLYMCVSTEPGMKCPGLFYDGPKKSRRVRETVSGESRPCGMALHFFQKVLQLASNKVAENLVSNVFLAHS